MYYIQVTPEFGRGLYAAHSIYVKSVVKRAEILVLSPDDTKKVNETDLKYYTFVFNEKQDCLVLGNGEIFNHSDEPNVRYDLLEVIGRKVMVFTAIKYIEPGGQLFIDYNQDTKNIDTKKYIDKNLIG